MERMDSGERENREGEDFRGYFKTGGREDTSILSFKLA